jgi:sugar phosphate isomerase/epimerase
MLQRRTFLKNAAALGAITLIEPQRIFAMPVKKQIGIQLYTIRDLVAEDFIGSMKKLASIGFNTIETAGYKDRKFYGYDPREFNKIVLDLGLNPLSSHSFLTPENIAETVEDTNKAGMKYLVQPFIPDGMRTGIDSYKNVAAQLNEMGEVCNPAGITLGYHNHAFEFERMDDLLPYDVLLEETDPGLVAMQLDTYWMVYGGYEPTEYFERYPGRFKLWHVKDMASGENRKTTEVGSGIIDFKQIFKLRKKAGMEALFLEQEEFSMDPWKSLEISCRYLKGLKY